MKKLFQKFAILLICFFILLVGSLFVKKISLGVDQSDYDDVKRMSADDISFPTVNYLLMPSTNIQPGQEINLKANPLYFSPEGVEGRSHFNWCIDNLPMQGKIAGSEDKIKGQEGGYYLENRYGKAEGGEGVCHLYELVNDENYKKIEDKSKAPDPGMSAPDNFYLTRKPILDSDGDGLDDDWEVKSFAGRRVPGTDVYFPSADERDKLLAAIGPENDPDEDGWEYPYTDAKGEWSVLTAIFAQYPLIKAPWMMGVPYAKNNITGDARFTNLEEYVFGTDPLSSDSDFDGAIDEADVAGLGQEILNLRVNKNEGEAYEVVLYAFSATQRWQNDKKNQKRQWEKYFRADFPNKRTGLYDLKESKPGENYLQIGSGSPKQIQLGYTPYPAYLGEEVEVRAETFSLSENKKDNFIYKWFRNTKQEDNEKNQSGLNNNIYKFKPDGSGDDPCREIIGVEVIDEKTQKMDYREIEIPLGLDLAFKKEILGSVKFNHKNENISKFNAKDSSPAVDYKTLIEPQKDLYLGEVNKDGTAGFRKGDLLNVSVKGLRENYDKMASCFDNLAFEDPNTNEDFLNSVSFVWSLNGTEMEAKSGKGKDFTNIRFVLTSEGLSEAKNYLSPDAAFTQGQEVISLEIQDSNGNLISKKTEPLKISPPYIEFSKIEGAEKGSSELGKEEKYSASEGKKIKVTAHLYNFRPSNSDGFTYIWERNGREVAKEERVSSNQATYEFKVGYDENGQKNSTSEETITLKVESVVDQEVYDKEEAINTLSISIPERKPEAEGALGGAMGKLFPSYYKQIFNLAFIPALVALVVLFGLEFGRMKKRE